MVTLKLTLWAVVAPFSAVFLIYKFIGATDKEWGVYVGSFCAALGFWAIQISPIFEILWYASAVASIGITLTLLWSIRVTAQDIADYHSLARIAYKSKDENSAALAENTIKDLKQDYVDAWMSCFAEVLLIASLVYFLISSA